MIYELGLLDEFLKLPHSVVKQISLQIGKDRVIVGHFEHLPVHCKFIALMPQWDFLNFIADRGRRYQTFDLRMQTEAIDLIEGNRRVAAWARNHQRASSKSAPSSLSAPIVAILPYGRKLA